MHRVVAAFHSWLARWILPRGFRDEYGEEVQAAFRERVASATGAAGAAVVALEFVDLLRTGLREHGAEAGTPVRLFIQAVRMDLSAALRTLRRAPMFSLAVIGIMGVAIGTTTAMFTVVDSVLLRPLPYPDADRIVRVAAEARPESGTDEGPFSPRGYWHIANNNRVFAEVGAGGVVQRALSGDGPPIQVDVALMTHGAFKVIGLEPLRGRFPTPEEDAPGTLPVALISNALWLDRYGADPAVLGQSIKLGPVVYEVIGVMRPDFDYPTPEIDAWVVRQLDPATTNFRAHFLEPIARLSESTTIETATQDVERLIQGFDELGYGPEWFESVFTGRAVVRPLQEDLVRTARAPLLILLGTVGILLIVAAANVANLLIVRMDSRSRALAVRQALGASNGRLASYAMAEAFVLALVGGLTGAGTAVLATGALVRASPVAIPRLAEIGFNASGWLFAVVVTLATAVAIGIQPATRAWSNPSFARPGGWRRRSTVQTHPRARTWLIVGQVALALVLLSASGLLVRSFNALRAVDPGFDPSGVLTFRLTPSPDKYPNPEASARFYDELLRELRDVPGVSSVGGSTVLPLTGSGVRRGVEIDGIPVPEGEAANFVLFRRTTPGYFAAMRIPIVEGRAFTPEDHQERLGTLLISESMKRSFWPGQSALGRRVTVDGAPGRVVGVVGDVRDAGLDSPPEHFVYKPLLDSVGGGGLAMTLAVRSSVADETLVAQLREVVSGIDPDLPVSRVQAMTDVVAASVNRITLTALLLLAAALSALFLASVGLYGVLSYLASTRRPEMGIRLALGAQVGSVRRMIIGQGLSMAAVGIGLGLVGALVVGPALSPLLFGVSPVDAHTLIIVTSVFLFVAVAAGVAPALRVGSTPPAEALRSQ